MKIKETTPSAVWTTPAIVDLDQGTGDVENQFNAGTDGAGGVTTSMS